MQPPDPPQPETTLCVLRIPDGVRVAAYTDADTVFDADFTVKSALQLGAIMKHEKTGRGSVDETCWEASGGFMVKPSQLTIRCQTVRFSRAVSQAIGHALIACAHEELDEFWAVVGRKLHSRQHVTTEGA